MQPYFTPEHCPYQLPPAIYRASRYLMVIRPMRQQDLPSVRDDYLPAARTWVAERESALAGLISVLRDKVVGALFVAPAHQHAGVGRVLMALAQQAYSALTLQVYRLNRHVCRFYHHRGFIPIAQRLNAETGHLILTLHWRTSGIMHSSTPPPPWTLHRLRYRLLALLRKASCATRFVLTSPVVRLFPAVKVAC